MSDEWQDILGWLAGSLSAAGAFLTLVWRNRKSIGEKLGAIRDLAVAPLAILDQLAEQAKRAEAAAQERKDLAGRLDVQSDAIRKQGAVLEKQDAVLAKMLAEMTTNGGSSIKDIVKNTNDLALITHQSMVASEARVRLLQQYADVCIFECDGDTGACIWVNEGICKLFDMHPDQMYGWGWLAAVEPTERETVKRAWKAAVDGGYPYSWEYTLIDAHGKRTRVLAKAHELRDKTGRRLMYQGTIKPIGEKA